MVTNHFAWLTIFVYLDRPLVFQFRGRCCCCCSRVAVAYYHRWDAWMNLFSGTTACFVPMDSLYARHNVTHFIGKHTCTSNDLKHPIYVLLLLLLLLLLLMPLAECISCIMHSHQVFHNHMWIVLMSAKL